MLKAPTMREYKVGYGRPPQTTRFKPGKSGNPKGRPKRQSSGPAEIIDAVIGATISYRENGRAKSASREEVAVRMLFANAIKGDLGAADHVLKLYARARRFGAAGANVIEVENWLPDHGGQTADKKSLATAEGQDVAGPVEWWNDPKQQERSS